MISLQRPSRSPLARVVARGLIVALMLALLPAPAAASRGADGPSFLAVVTDGYTYSAFGELLAHTGSDPQPYAFTGEPYDPNVGFQYHRARWMDPRVGRFTGMDPFKGSALQPISLHRYLYARSDPVMRGDPLGLFDQDMGYAVEDALRPYYEAQHPGHVVSYGGEVGVGLLPQLRPDIFNFTKGTYLEIKPFSVKGTVHGGIQMALYDYAFGLFDYRPEYEWRPPRTIVARGTLLGLFNFEGIIFYTDLVEKMREIVLLGSLAAMRDFLRSGAAFAGRLNEFARIARLAPIGQQANSIQLQHRVQVQTLMSTLRGGI